MIRLALEPILVGRTLRVVEVGPHDMRARGEGRGLPFRGPWLDRRSLLDGACVARLERRGKRLAFVARDGRALVVQLGMSGQLLAVPSDERSHRHVAWAVSGRKHPVVFRDPRRFGGLTPYASIEDLRAAWDSELGDDALTITSSRLADALTGARTVKAALLDQQTIAGVGNIYADESLFRAGINPRTRCSRLGARQVHALASAIREVLRRAVRTGGSTLRDHRTAFGVPGAAQQTHAVYGRAGQPCPGCGIPIRSTRMAGRATCWCPRCQRRSARSVWKG